MYATLKKGEVLSGSAEASARSPLVAGRRKEVTSRSRISSLSKETLST